MKQTSQLLRSEPRSIICSIITLTFFFIIQPVYADQANPTPLEDGRDELVAEELDAASEMLERQKSVYRADVQEFNTGDSDQPLEALEMDDDVQADLEAYDEQGSIPADNKIDRERLKKIEVALQLSAYRYDAESYSPYYYSIFRSVGNEVRKKGQLWGAYLTYTYRRPYDAPVHHWRDLKQEYGGPGYPFTFYRFETDAAWGETSYKSFVTAKREGIDAWRVNTRILGGYDFLSEDQSFMVSPYIGFGFRRFVDQAGGWVDVRAQEYHPYEKIYNYFYIPLGFDTLKQHEKWDLGFRLEGSVLLTGSVTFGQSDITEVFNSSDFETGEPLEVRFQDTDSRLTKGYGLKTSVKMIRKFETYNIFAEPFFEGWYLGKSKTVASRAIDQDGGARIPVYPDGSPYEDTFEPANYMIESGVRLGLQF